jgi:hypothetical protein
MHQFLWLLRLFMWELRRGVSVREIWIFEQVLWCWRRGHESSKVWAFFRFASYVTFCEKYNSSCRQLHTHTHHLLFQNNSLAFFITNSSSSGTARVAMRWKMGLFLLNFLLHFPHFGHFFCLMTFHPACIIYELSAQRNHIL